MVNNSNSKFSNSYNFQNTNTPNMPILYGVGMNYQLLELQQVYRHPRKIYDIAVNIQTVTQLPSANSKSNNLSSQQNTKGLKAGVSSGSTNSTAPNLHSSIIQVSNFNF